VNDVVGGDGLYGDAQPGPGVAVFQGHGPLDLSGRRSRCKDDRPVLAERLDGRDVQMVPVLVGDQHEVRLRQRPVVGEPTPGIDVDHLPPEPEHERPVADEGDLRTARGVVQGFGLECECRRARQGRQSEQCREDDSHGCLPGFDMPPSYNKRQRRLKGREVSVAGDGKIV